MGAVISPGTFTSHRYALTCPRCGNPNARPDCDNLGRSVILCRCRSTPILMPVAAPVVELSLAIVTAARARRPRLDTKPEKPKPVRSDRFCVRGCGRRRGPKAKHCNPCAKLVAGRFYPCPEPGCENTRNHKQHRCSDCQRARYQKQWADRSARIRQERERRQAS